VCAIPDNNFEEPERDGRDFFDESNQRPEKPVNKPEEAKNPRKGPSRRKASGPSKFDIFQAKNDGELSSDLSERKHEGFRKLLIGIFQALQCLDFPGVKELLRLKSLSKCNGVIKAMAVDLGEEPNTISHWLLGLEKMYEKNKKRLMGDKKKKGHKKED